MKSCTIIVYIDKEPEKFLKETVTKGYVICADIGYSHAAEAGIRPDLVIGDFDSCRENIPADMDCIRLPKEKDDTDTHYCVKYAIDAGFDDILILGGTGGRLDHTVANLQTMRYASQHGCRVTMKAPGSQVHVITNSSITVRKKDSYLSVLSLSDISEGVTITGAAYNVENAVLNGSFPIGTSNEFIDETVEISVKSGTLAIILSEE